jgi:hypothetical protein
MVATVGDAVGDTGEGSGAGGPFAVQAAEDVDLDGAVDEGRGEDHEGGHVDVVDFGPSLVGDGFGEFDS